MESRECITGGRILVAVDDEQTCALLRTGLESAGYIVTLTKDGHDALRMVFGERVANIRLVISDFDMVDKSGVELVRVLACYVRSSQFPIIVLSRTHESTGVRLNTCAWLEKPFELEALLALVRTHASPLPII